MLDSSRFLVRILDQERSQTLGAGFFITAAGHILTCWHVLEPLLDHERIPIAWEGLADELATACLLPNLADPGKDFAVIKVSPTSLTDNLKLPSFGGDCLPGEDLFSRGFQDEEFASFPANGKFIGETDRLDDGNRYWVLEGAYRFKPGLSGAPVWSERSGRVLGMVVRKKDVVEEDKGAYQDTSGLVLPLDTLVKPLGTDPHMAWELEGFLASLRRETSPTQRDSVGSGHGPVMGTQTVVPMSFAEEVKAYLALSGWDIVKDLKANEHGERDLLAAKTKGLQRIKTFIRCTSQDVGLKVAARFKKDKVEKGIPNGKLITERRVDRFARDKFADQTTTIQSFRDFFEEVFPLRTYFEWLEDICREFNILEYYIDLRCAKIHITDEGQEMARSQSGYFDGYVEDWLGAQGDERGLAVLGDFGSGKTWFCRHYAHKQKKDFQRRPRRERIPILIALGQLKGKLATHEIFRHFSALFQNRRVSPAFFDLLNRQGRLLLILDGFDEITRKQQSETIWRNFQKLMALAQPASKVIITSRTTYFRSVLEEHRLLEAKFDTVYLEDLDKVQIRKLLKKRVPEDWRDYLGAIRSIYNLADLSQRPVMLDMIIKTIPFLSQREKVNTNDLYRAYTERWIHRIGEKQRAIQDAAKRNRINQDLAWYLFIEDRVEIAYEEIESLIRELFGLEDEAMIGDYARDIRTQSFLVRNVEGFYYFSHKSFMEYFVAYRLFEDMQKGDRQGFMKDQLPTEIMQFLKLYPIDIERLLAWLQANRGKPEMASFNGNIITLLRHLAYDMRGFDFSQLYLKGADFSETNLRGAKFVEARLDGVNFRDTKLDQTDFTNAVLNNLILGVRSAAKSVAYHPDGHFIAAPNGDNHVALWPVDGGERRIFSGHRDSITNLAISKDGTWLASVGFDERALVWKLKEDGKPLRFRDHQAIIYGVDLDPMGRFMATSDNAKLIKIWDLYREREITTLTGHRETVYNVQFHPQGLGLVSASFDKTVGVWAFDRTEEALSLRTFDFYKEHEGLVNSACFHPEGLYIASAGNDHVIHLWDVATLQTANRFPGHEDTIWSVAFHPKGTHVVSGSTDQTVRVWDLETGKTIVLEGHTSEVWCVRFSPDGTKVLSGSYDNTVRLWDWRAQRCLTTFPVDEDANQQFSCASMKLSGTKGLSDLQKRFLLREGAIK